MNAITIIKSIPFGFIIISLIHVFKPYTIIENFFLFFLFVAISIYIHYLAKKFEKDDAFLLKSISYYPVCHFLDNIIVIYFFS